MSIRRIGEKKISLILAACMALSGTAISFGTDDDISSEGAVVSEVAEETVSGAAVEDAEKESTEEQEKKPEKKEPVFSDFKDVKGHWGYDSLEKAFNDGLITGFENGTMRPDDPITGAQMTAVLTRMLKSDLRSDSSVSSLSDKCWYKDNASQAAALGIIDESKVADLSKETNRKDALLMMNSAFQLESGDPDTGTSSSYTDFSPLSSSDKNVIASLVNSGYVNGYNNSLMLSSNITRAEFVTVLYRVIESNEELGEDGRPGKTGHSVMLEGGSADLNGTSGKEIWLACDIKNVSVDGARLDSLTVLSDDLGSFSMVGSSVDRLVMAPSRGDLNMDLRGVKTFVLGKGSGKADLTAHGGNIDITGSSRSIGIGGNAGVVAVSGNNNTINIDASGITSLVVSGSGNKIFINSSVGKITSKGSGNDFTGYGTADEIVMYSQNSTYDLECVTVTDKRDTGIAGMRIKLDAPTSAPVGKEFTVTGTPVDAPAGKDVAFEWYIDGRLYYTESKTLGEGVTTSISPLYEYYSGMENAVTIYCCARYTTAGGDPQKITSPPVTVRLDKSAFEPTFESVKAKVTNVYKGNRTQQWAIDHDISGLEKEVFVNGNGYSSDTGYLIWVNIGSQHTTVFKGSKGRWQIVRSGLVSTGAGDCTPKGVFKTTYKQQSGWTTDTYTVKPVVRFYGGGYAFHSRLYKPGTTTLKGGNNGVGVPYSHGCVRMEAEDIQYIYDNIPNGTTVVVY